MANTQSGKVLPLVIIGVIALVAGFLVYSQFNNGQPNTAARSENSEQMIALQETLKSSLALPTDFKSVADFTLQDVNGEAITQAVLDNRWSLMFFGYTRCPDVCPITLQVLKNVVTQIEAQGKVAPQIVFVSVDPVRDTSEVMKKYIDYFDERFVGITGDMNKVHALTSALGIVASFTANEDDPENYMVDHSASLLLIDPQRRLRAKVTPPLEAENIISDYLNIVAAPT